MIIIHLLHNSLNVSLSLLPNDMFHVLNALCEEHIRILFLIFIYFNDKQSQQVRIKINCPIK